MGGASVSFGFAAERDKAANELNGRELHGCRISVTKQADPVEPSAPQNRKRPLEEEIHDLLRQYQVPPTLALALALALTLTLTLTLTLNT